MRKKTVLVLATYLKCLNLNLISRAVHTWLVHLPCPLCVAVSEKQNPHDAGTDSSEPQRLWNPFTENFQLTWKRFNL